ncbi:uncharacterized protein LOC124634458 isoform X3 [Helicoverpa zea]|uniref:uncharacterized protein LOC124634458 isoform X3 n=1 Tax=Helicoverpa zea TaxID=7113 RepID=UPI001F560713|nr:uncharacterized protein LOC124634458 isoform X3 [Helicoverpa zea]
MPLIEGIGDEVVQFVAVVLVIVIAAVAWWSTNAQPDRYRAVLVMRSRTNHPVTVSIRTRSNLMITAEPAPSIQAALSDGPMPTAAEAANEDTSRVIPLQEMDSIVDADMAMLDNNRLHFYRRVDSNNTQTAPESTSDESEVHEEVEPASNAQIREMDSIVSAMEADVTAGCDLFTRAGGKCLSDCLAHNTQSNESEVHEEVEPASNAQIREMDSIVSAMEADVTAGCDLFTRAGGKCLSDCLAHNTQSNESEVHEEVEPASNAQIREMDSIVSAMEADVTAGCDLFTRAGEPNPATVIPTDTKKENDKETSAPSTANVEKSSETATTDNVMPTEGAGDVTAEEQESRRILIKLKYLNDTLKEVEGSLDELLKDFKWRHFSTELTAECRVRLIFNGRVLLDDAATLRACGLHDRAVVHCLVHPKRTVNQRGSGEEGAGAAPELVSERAAPERAWDLENILMTLVSVALTVVWFFRCEYSNLFTASASLALFGLTVFYSVAIFGLYLSDTFQFDRRPPQPVPDN